MTHILKVPDQDSQWGLIMLGRLREDFGWTIRYEHLADGGNTLVMERALVSPFGRPGQTVG
jgi:hypothetical protein